MNSADYELDQYEPTEAAGFQPQHARPELRPVEVRPIQTNPDGFGHEEHQVFGLAVQDRCDLD
jgi:hypothetical protein